MSKVEAATIHTVAILIGIVASFLAVTWLWSFRTIIEVTDNPKEIIEVIRDKEFRYCRNVKYLEDVVPRLDKSLILKVEEDSFIPHNFPSFYVHREKGFDETICKQMVFPPELKQDGLYKMVTYITYDTLPFWKTSIKLEDIYLNVTTKE